MLRTMAQAGGDDWSAASLAASVHITADQAQSGRAAHMLTRAARLWIGVRKLPIDGRMGNGKNQLLLRDIGVCAKVRAWLSEAKEFQLRALLDFVHTVLPQQLGERARDLHLEISSKTARKWLRYLGFTRANTAQKGIYIDGHERKDVVEQRKLFVEYMAELSKLMPLFEQAEQAPRGSTRPELREVPPSFEGVAEEQRKPHIWVTQDESTFWANDGCLTV